ncbi:hypothetical protein T484DRAFT_3639922 [Baffinella frigidus]|nr:hypothetical protein T484DRAFT_3639922 [Cryptophyta sp. CCMP2293]
MVYGVWCMVYGVWCMVYGVWCMVYGVWCMVNGVWCMVYGVWCMVCMVYGVWCMVYGVRFMVSWGMVYQRLAVYGVWGVWCVVYALRLRVECLGVWGKTRTAPTRHGTTQLDCNRLENLAWSTGQGSGFRSQGLGFRVRKIPSASSSVAPLKKPPPRGTCVRVLTTQNSGAYYSEE